VPFWLLASGISVAMAVAVGAVARKLVNGLPKQQKLQVDCPHTLVCKESDTKQCVKPASVDSARLLLRQFSFVSEW
jgi:hypothetical protein